MTVDYPDYQEPQANATAISVTGTPLLHGWDSISSASVAVAAGSVNSITINFGKPGYFFSIWAAFTAGGAATPFLTVQMTWENPATGNFIAQEVWTLPIGPLGSFIPVYAKGPCKSSRLIMKFTNNDAGVSCNVFFELSETTHHIARDDWRGQFNSAIAVYNPPPISDQMGGILGAGNGTVLAISSSVKYLLPLYSGQAYLYVTCNQSLNISIQSLDPMISIATVWQVSLVNAQLSPQTIPLPRSPCLITFTNPSGTNTVTFTWYMGYLEYAS